jgi:hypothetical protein
MNKKKDPAWRSYEEIAAYVLNQCAAEFGLDRFEGKQLVAGKCGTEWQVDARGWSKDGSIHVVVECKKHTDTGISQAITASLAYVMTDTGAAGGFLVSPNGLQAGGKKVAAAEGIHEIKLDPASTTSAYFGEWLGSLRAGFTDHVNVNIGEHVLIQLIDKDGNVTQAYDSEMD